jgi:outer membrane biosynthesis protein TonB
MSSTLFNVLFAWKCSSTHHKLALDALNHIRGPAADNWRNLCLKNVETYLDGSKAPDNKFKDFKNHVLHVRDNYWGGAITATQKWYDATVEALRAKKWSDAIYAAGVLSHYYTDPIQPYHTGQCEAEGVVHRAAEWSIACAYRDLTDILEADLGGWPEVTVPAGMDWLPKMVIADLANPHYEVCIEHYDIKQGVKNPPAGLDQEMKDRIAKLIGHAVVGYARIMERALADAEASPPATSITLLGIMSQLTIPIFWVTKKLKDAKERAIVEATFKEFQATGKVVDALTEDDYTIRAIHAEEVLKQPLEQLDEQAAPTSMGVAHGTGAPARPRPTKQVKPKAPPATVPVVADAPKPVPTKPAKVEPPKIEQKPVEPVKAPVTKPAATAPTPTVKAQPATPPETKADRFYLDLSMPVEKAPSIGAKTAAVLEKQGIETVGDLLSIDPDRLADRIKDPHIDSYTILTWQMQADLCCTVPSLRGHDAQILTACGISHRDELASARADALLHKVDSFVITPAGERILRGGERPDLKEVSHWISCANQPPQAKAA